jgi:squalene synthase HpnC
VEGARAGEGDPHIMTSAGSLRSGKSHRDENFPVASWLIHPRHREPILAFYQFVRTADDIADHPTLAPEKKLALLDQLEADLDGADSRNPEGVALRMALTARGLSPRHAKDLLTAFRLDVTKLRYSNWDDLIGYCAYSAMPVGRFVLDVHGESQSVWPANDALCAALQIINHLQDCKADYGNLNRVYVPLDALAAAGLGVEALGEARASPALLGCLHELAARTERLLCESDDFANLVQDRRLGLEIAVIVQLAHRLTHLLMRRDPLSERVHLDKFAVAGTTATAVIKHAVRAFGSRTAAGIRMVRNP